MIRTKEERRIAKEERKRVKEEARRLEAEREAAEAERLRHSPERFYCKDPDKLTRKQKNYIYADLEIDHLKREARAASSIANDLMAGYSYEYADQYAARHYDDPL